MSFLIFTIKTFFFVGYLVVLILEVTIRQTAARSALELPHAKVGGPFTDFKHCINQYILSTWQGNWNGAFANKLHSVKPVMGDWQSSYRRCSKNEIILCRTHLTHSYILKKDPPSQC